MVVKAFDRSRRTIIYQVYLPIQIDPRLFQITFQVMDINLAYSCLLVRPWIHVIGMITSTIHQKMKFLIKGKLIIAFGEEDLLIIHLSPFWYIEAGEEVLETSSQALEIANVVFLEEKDQDTSVSSSFSLLKSAKKMQEKVTPKVGVI